MTRPLDRSTMSRSSRTAMTTKTAMPTAGSQATAERSKSRAMATQIDNALALVRYIR
ncbi:MAG: hypothetical protein II951_06240 [Bacteroidales bacterium]|nr:hypothetical protein [Bacteroidales bacterium]